MTHGEIPIFEKKVRNRGPFRVPREVGIQHLAAGSQKGDDPFTVPLEDHRTGLITTVLRMERMIGTRGMPALESLGPFLASIEKKTLHFLAAQPGSVPKALDFYGSGGHRGPRYDIDRIARRYKWLSRKRLAALDRVLASCSQSIRHHEAILKVAPRVVSHLDPFGANFLQVDGRLLLIDWGEGFVGRPGFDAGAVLMVLFRKYGIQAFLREAPRFLRSYVEAAPAMEPAYLQAAINRIFLPRSLWFLLRPHIVRSYRDRDQAHLWLEKIVFLETCASGSVWREMLDHHRPGSAAPALSIP